MRVDGVDTARRSIAGFAALGARTGFTGSGIARGEQMSQSSNSNPWMHSANFLLHFRRTAPHQAHGFTVLDRG